MTLFGLIHSPRLRLVMLLILTIPYSNAEDESVFSIVKENKICFQSILDLEKTLASIVGVKLAVEAEVTECFKIPDEILRDTKSATYLYKLELHFSSIFHSSL